MAALAGFTALEAKVVRLRRAMAGVELQQLSALGELADVAGVELAAELTGVSTSAAREASLHDAAATPELPRRRRG